MWFGRRLQPVTDKVRAAFIYGSVAKAKSAETASSDIDLMVIGDVGFVGSFRV
jgi:predicted nucleotidyltransferase